MRSPPPNSCIIAAALCLSTAAADPLEAQARSKPLAQTSVETTPIYACYVPVAGLVYIIKEPGIAQTCLSLGPVQHAQISWDRVGPKGDKGAAGGAGPAGNPGPQGATGDKGPAGPAGAQGPAGDKGPSGETGPPGEAGAVGDKGPAGDKGANGDPGAAGDKGEVGDKGPPGEQGPVGDKGPVGDAGVAGEKGPVGDKGPSGDNGEVGDKGEAGDKGAVGDKGPVGLKGLTGDKGSIGPAGPDGANLPCNDGCVTTPIIADLAVTNAKLATISASGRILNSATTATSANLANRIIARDAAGGFSAGSVTMTDLNLFGVGAQVFHGAVSRLLYNVHSSSPPNSSIYFGIGAGTSATFTPTQHVGVGTGANRATSGSHSTAVGFEALNGGSSFGATVIGAFAADNGFFPGERHVAIGWRAGRGLTGEGNSLARRIIVIGPEAGTNLFTHNNVVAVGRATVIGGNATHVGTEGTHLRTFVAGIDNSTISGIPVMVNTAGQLGVALSSARFKVGVRDIGDASSVVSSLRPVSYRYRRDLDRLRVPQYGLIAEEVGRVAPSLVARDSTERPYTVRYEMLVPLLVNEVQLRRTRLAKLQAQSAKIRLRVEQLEVTAKP